MEGKTENELRAHFKRLGFTNAVIFALVMMQRNDLCRKVIELCIGKPVDEVEVITSEKTLLTSLATKTVRLDAHVWAGKVEFDIEMQVRNEKDIPRRSRFYHAKMDTSFLGKAEDYEKLPLSYVIFIGKDLLFGDRKDCKPVRRFRMIDPDTLEPLGDGTETVILNGSAWEQAEGDLRDMLEYVHKGNEAESLKDEDSFASALFGAVEDAKESDDEMIIMTAATQLERSNKEKAAQDKKLAQAKKQLAQKDEIIAQQDEEKAQKDKIIAQKDEIIAQQAKAGARKDEENRRLRAALAKLEAAQGTDALRTEN